MKNALPPLLVVLLCLAVVELVGRTGLVSADVLPPPSVTILTLAVLLVSPTTWVVIIQTLTAAFGGFLIAAVIAVPVGLLLGRVRWIRESTRVVVEFLRPIPPMALLPLAVLLWGTGIGVKLPLVIFGAFFPVMIQAIAGASDVDPVAREAGRVYGFSRLQQIRWVLVPSATPNIATGLRLGVIVALTVTIATELVVGTEGLGYAINQARFAGLPADMYAFILLTGVLGYMISTGMRLAETRVLSWHVSTRQGAAS